MAAAEFYLSLSPLGGSNNLVLVTATIIISLSGSGGTHLSLSQWAAHNLSLSQWARAALSFLSSLSGLYNGLLLHSYTITAGVLSLTGRL